MSILNRYIYNIINCKINYKMAPTQAKFFKEQFGGEFVLKTFVNNNVDNTFMFMSDKVCILVDEDYSSIEIQLGGSSHNERRTGKVRSTKKQLNYVRPSGDIAEINEAKRLVLEDTLSSSSDLYEAWVNEFGEDSILEDSR